MRRVVRILRAALPLALALALLLFALPRMAGGHWAAIGGALSGISPAILVGLAVLWLVGLVAHMLVLTAALPGLTVGRGLLMSLTGSAVSNVLPLGGAAGTALNYSMVRRWGHSRAAFVTFAVVSHLWGMVAKLVLPVLALAAVLLSGGSTAMLLIPAGIAGGVLLGLAVLGWALVARETAVPRAARALERLLGAVLRRPIDLYSPAVTLREHVIAMTRRDWRRPAAGMVAYFTLQALLLWLCLLTVGAGIGPITVFAVYAVERVLTVVVLTPGGLGVVEVTTTAMLVAAGVTPPVAAAGVLLYRAFTFALEIPVGGALLLGWLSRCRRVAPLAVAE